MQDGARIHQVELGYNFDLQTQVTKVDLNFEALWSDAKLFEKR